MKSPKKDCKKIIKITKTSGFTFRLISEGKNISGKEPFNG